MKITLETKIFDALKMSENVRKVFEKYNLICSTCKGSKQDSINKAIVNNGLNGEAFLKEINDAAK